ncbi:MAG: NHL repeat-containing protein [Treponema sp.]|jgi:DNA-binding beta-propeller fold protein YncE|nr:NHL repeat-containing protein [Treponema sp.]
MMGTMKKKILFIALAAAFCRFLYAQQGGAEDRTPIPGIGINTLEAREEFRLGIQAYNRCAFNEAILSFERALSYRPGEPMILEWLGRSYYRSGMEETALMQWREAGRAYGWNSGPGVLLGSMIETVSNRRSFLPVEDDEIRYVESGRYPGVSDGTVLFRQPTAVLPLDDGSAWIVAYGSNELVRVDVNGVIHDRSRGPVNGFDRPYDLVKGPGDLMYLSEYRGGRISVLNLRGEWQSYIGARGRGAGQFIGPQNLAVDEEGYLYVVDYGNRRISKFDPSGAFILSFGRRDGIFQGFLSPTGIAVRGGRVYVADGAQKRIAVFDRNGSYQEDLTAGLSGPESLRFLSDGKLLAADTNRVLLVDTDTAVIRELGAAGNSRARITGADMDRNGNILAVNFDAGEVSILTRLDDMASGLFVQIERVSAEQFPRVTVELRVEDRLRRPLVGLQALNFLITEGGREAAGQTLAESGYRLTASDIAILAERSPAAAALRDDLAAAARDIAAALAPGQKIRSFVSAGDQPQRERIDPLNPRTLEAAARGSAGIYSPRWRFDLALRLAATDLLAGAKKRAVIFITTGTPGERAFENYGLSALAAYMANNGIVFNAVVIGEKAPQEEIRYLCRETGGKTLSLYRPEGAGELVRNLASVPSGSYILSYQSSLAADFGRAYLPVEAEVYLMERSGRDGIIYFPPLE